MKTFKSLLFAALVSFSFAVHADDVAYPLTANTSSNLLSVSTIIDSITFTAGTASITTVKFYDSANTTTNIVTPAYISFGSYATNVSVIFTNENNILMTNIYPGRWTYTITNAQATNSLTPVFTLVVAGSATRTRTAHIQVQRGLTAVPNQDGVVEVTYRKNP